MPATETQEHRPRKPELQGNIKRHRVVSLPPSLASNSTQPSVYNNPTNRFSGSSSPPIIDFTEWADNFRGQRFCFSIPGELSPEATRTGPHSILCRNTGVSSHGWRIEYSVLLNTLRALLKSQGKGLDDILDTDDIATLHKRDREYLKQHSQNKDGLITPCIDGVIGKRLSDVFLHASLLVPIAGSEHLVPTIVVKCVEELYRTGLYQPQLFRKTPNFLRVEELVEIYDHRESPNSVRVARQRLQHPQHALPCGNYFGAQTSLHMETTENICAVLRTFLQYLPEPILSPCLFEAIWNCCGIRQEAFQSSLHQASSHARVPPSRLGSSPSSEELTRIYMAQILLHLLPTPNFSLMVYLLSFFSQVIMVHEENGLAINDVASMFGVIIFGGAAERIVSWTDSKPRPRGEIMMRWFLRRWRQVYNGLFPYDDDGRTSTSGVGSLSPTHVAIASDKISTMVRPASGYFGLKDPATVSEHDALVLTPKDMRGTSTSHDEGTSEDTPSLPPVSHPKPTDHIDPALHPATDSRNYLEGVWPHLPSDMRMKLNDRMLDVMLEPLITDSTKMSRQRSNSVPSRLTTSNLPSTAGLGDSALQCQLALATQRIASLERWVHDNQQVLQDTVGENQRIKQDKALLEVRIKGLEVELEMRDTQYREIEGRVKKGMKATVEGVVRERDEAMNIVSEIQKLSSKVNGGCAAGGGFTRN